MYRVLISYFRFKMSDILFSLQGFFNTLSVNYVWNLLHLIWTTPDPPIRYVIYVPEADIMYFIRPC